MSSISLTSARAFLSQSFAGLNQNKLYGTLAEIAFREYLQDLGFQDRVSPGGWIVRRKGPGVFAHSTAALFPEIVTPNQQYRTNRQMPNPAHGLHTICSTFHQSGIASFYCAATIRDEDNPLTLQWYAVELGLPVQRQYSPLIEAVGHLGFRVRERRYNFLRHHTDVTAIDDNAIPEEFSKEHLRIAFSSHYLAEVSDIDGIFWGQQHTYPLEIKEKTPAESADLGPFFGLDVGPFVKLAFYAAKRGNLHSLYVVREIDNEVQRNHVQWWFMKFDQLAQFASWVAQAGGPGMGGGPSSVVRVPKCEFHLLNAGEIAEL